MVVAVHVRDWKASEVPRGIRNGDIHVERLRIRASSAWKRTHASKTL